MSELVGNPEDRFSHNETHIFCDKTECKVLDAVSFGTYEIDGLRLIATNQCDKSIRLGTVKFHNKAVYSQMRPITAFL